MTSCNRYIELNNELFKKTTTRLKHQLSQLPNENGYSLAQVQELLSKSLGFRNFDAVNHYFGSNNKLPVTKKTVILHSWNYEELSEFFSLFLSTTEDTWNNPSLLLINTVTTFLIYMHSQGEITLSANTYREYLNFDTILNLYQVRKDFPTHIRAAIQNYLLSIPDFYRYSNGKQFDSVYQHHNNLQRQFTTTLNLLENLETKDPLILAPNWFQVNYEAEGRTITNPLTPENLFKLYNQFSEEEWQGLFQNKPINYQTNQGNTITLKNIELIPEIIKHSCFEGSKFADIAFQELVNTLFMDKEMKALYLSDLFLLGFRSTHERKQLLYPYCAEKLLRNYSVTLEESKNFNELALNNAKK